MKTLCDELIADMTDCRQDTATITDPESVAAFEAAVPRMVKASQCTLDETVVAWNHGGEWIAFKKVEDETGVSVKVKWCAKKPKWFCPPPPVVRKRLVAVMVPEHLVKAMRLHLGELANRVEVAS